jgi:hypothetical protein
VNRINQYLLIIDISEQFILFLDYQHHVRTSAVSRSTNFSGRSSAHEIYFITNSNNAEFLAYMQSKYVTWTIVDDYPALLF